MTITLCNNRRAEEQQCQPHATSPKSHYTPFKIQTLYQNSEGKCIHSQSNDLLNIKKRYVHKRSLRTPSPPFTLFGEYRQWQM